MFKSISAAAIALSLIAAPAFAQGNAPAVTPAPVTAPAKPVVQKTHKVHKHVATHKAVKHVAHKHSVKKRVVKHKAAKLKTAKVKATRTVKPKAI